MNLSGRAIREIMDREDIQTDRVIVIHDDMDIPLGRLKIKRGGSSGGHRGVQSIIDHLGSGDFIRVKIGIGRPPGGLSPTEYVLQEFGRDEALLINKLIKVASEATMEIIRGGLDRAMSLYNRSFIEQ